MTVLEFILFKQLDTLLTNLNGNLGQLLSGLATEFVHLLNVLVSFLGSVLPPHTS